MLFIYGLGGGKSLFSYSILASSKKKSSEVSDEVIEFGTQCSILLVSPGGKVALF